MMDFSLQTKIQNELLDLKDNPIQFIGMSAGLVNMNDLRTWKICMLAPKDCLYKDNLFSLTINFPNDYPKAPPEIFFVTPIYHLNVNPIPPRYVYDPPLGYVNIKQLGFWYPGAPIKEIILHIYSLFYYVDINCPYNDTILDEYLNNRKIYEEKVDKLSRKNNIFINQNQLANWNF